MYLLGARWYDPAIARFVSTDPHPGNQDDPVTLNEYVYCRNNPVNNIDPNGEFAQYYQLAIAGGGTMGALGGMGLGAAAIAATPYLLAIAAGVALGIGGNAIYQVSKKRLKKGEKSLDKDIAKHKVKKENTNWEPRQKYYDKEIKSKTQARDKIKGLNIKNVHLK